MVNLIRNIRTSVGGNELRRKTRHLNRQKAIHNFHTASSAGILFCSRGEEDFNAIKDFRQFLEHHQIDTEVLGYVHDKQVPDHYLLRSGFNFFCIKDLNWYRRPTLPSALDFSARKFDILFDLSTEDHFPLKYLSDLSPASYKVGILSGTRDFDLMFELGEDKSPAYLVGQVRHYLSLIQSKKG